MKLLLYATLREIAGQSEVVLPLLEPRDLITYLSDLADQYGSEWRDTVLSDDGTLSEYVRVYLNGKEIDKAANVLVSDTDEVEILVPVAGG